MPRLGGGAARGCSPAYVEAKQAAQVLDYDDLLLYWAEMLADPDTAARVGAALRPCADRRVPGHQPAAGARSCAALKPDGRGVTVVGDDAQAIYGFRAAEVRNILDFPGQFEPRARIVDAGAQLPLDRSRSSPRRTR